MFPAAWNGVTRNGKIYGMPWLMDVKYFMYNKDMLEQSRLHRTAQDLGRAGRAGQDHQEKGLAEFPIIWSWNQKEGVVCDFTVLLFGNGGAFLDASGKPVFNNEKGVQVLTWMKQTIDDGLTNPSSVSSDENAVRDQLPRRQGRLRRELAVPVRRFERCHQIANRRAGCLLRRCRSSRPVRRRASRAPAWMAPVPSPSWPPPPIRPDLEIPDLPGQQRSADEVFGRDAARLAE